MKSIIKPIAAILLLPFSLIAGLAFRLIYGRKALLLRINRSYLGHLALDPAIGSSYALKFGYHAIASLYGKEESHLCLLTENCRKVFTTYPDVLIKCLSFTYYYSPRVIQFALDNLFYPLVPFALPFRELRWQYLLGECKSSAWSNGIEKLISEENASCNGRPYILVALRTVYHHLNNKKVESQPARNLEYDEILHILESLVGFSDVYDIVYFGSKHIISRLQNEPPLSKLITYAYEENSAILSLVYGATLLINNGNGIGALALTLEKNIAWIKHSPWLAWATYTSKSFIFPPLYEVVSVNGNRSSEFKYLHKTALGGCDADIFDHKKYFENRNIILSSITDIPLSTLISSFDYCLKNIEDDIFQEHMSNPRHESVRCNWSTTELVFWGKFYDYLSPEGRACHESICASIPLPYLQYIESFTE